MSETILSAFLTFNQMFAAGNTITAFSLLLYSLTFNLRNRVARSFALLLGLVSLVYFGDVLSSTTSDPGQLETWLRLQWIGISFVPAVYLQLSDALLDATGKPSRGRRRAAVLFSYIFSGLALIAALFTRSLAGEVVTSDTVSYLEREPLFLVFALFALSSILFAGVNFWRAYKRNLTRASRRRMRYLMGGSLGPLLGTFPFLMISSSIGIEFPAVFWSIMSIINPLVAVLLVVMSYSIAYYGVSYPDRVIKSRLFQWIFRGPIVASSVLATFIAGNRFSEIFSIDAARVTPFLMVAVLLLLQHTITLIRIPIERWLFYGEDREDVYRLHVLDERLLTSGDLRQYLETILNAACDISGVSSAFVAVVGPKGIDLEVGVGDDNPMRSADDLPALLMTENEHFYEGLGMVFVWDRFWLMPLNSPESEETIGIFGLQARSSEPDFNLDEIDSLGVLVERATVALTDRILQREVFDVVDRLLPQAKAIQNLRAKARYGGAQAFTNGVDGVHSEADIANLVRDALSHYWGGPRLTKSPLTGLRIVRESIERHNGNTANALRDILKLAIDRVKPEGERRFTAEWMLYNILELKFLEGRKVRDVAMRLAMSEADLYRKQRVAIEEVAQAITDMEREVISNRSNAINSA
jgi:hypothetical protein